MHFPELVRDMLLLLTRLIDHDGQQEGLVRCDQMRAIDRELPFEPEVPLGPLMGVFRDDGNKERAGLDLLADRLIPGIPASQLALIEKHLDAGRTQGLANLLGSLRIL